MSLKPVAALILATMTLSTAAHASRVIKEGTFCGTIVEKGVTLSGSHGPMTISKTSLHLANTNQVLEVIFYLGEGSTLPQKYTNLDAHYEARKIIGKLHEGPVCIDGLMSGDAEGNGGWIFPVAARQEASLAPAAEPEQADDSTSAQ